MRDGHDDDDGDFGIPPIASHNRHSHADILPSEAVRRRMGQGASPALRESRGNVWHTALCRAKCSVLHPVNAVRKIRGFF